jgi:hypothetical protein
MKKLLSLALVLVMLLTQFAFPSFADVADKGEDPFKNQKVVSIEIEQTRPLYVNADGWYVDCSYKDHKHDQFFEYDLYNDIFVYTVTYKNGEIEKGTTSELYGDLTIEDTQSENHWMMGKDYYMSVTYRNMKYNFTPEMAASPVAKVTAVAQKSLVEGWDSYVDYSEELKDEYPSYYLYDAEPVFTVTMKDGTVYKGTDNELYEQTGFYTYEAESQAKKPLKVGKNTVKFTFMGVEFNCEIEILPNPYKSVKISGENELILEFEGVDKKDSFKTKAVQWEGWIDEYCAWGDIKTENGKTYSVEYYCGADESGILTPDKEVSLQIGPFRTNTLKTNNWLLAYMTAEEVAYNSMAYYLASENLTGTRFKNYFKDEEYNIDDLVAISTYICDENPSGTNEDGYVHSLKVDAVEKNIKSVFGLTDVNVKKSSFYSILWRKVMLEQSYDNGHSLYANDLVFEDGKWVLYSEGYMYETGEYVGEMVVILNADLTVDGIYFTQKTIELGDVNFDGVVTAVDARLVLQYVAGIIEDYEINMYYANVNGDETVTAVDARLILQKVAGLTE